MAEPASAGGSSFSDANPSAYANQDQHSNDTGVKADLAHLIPPLRSASPSGAVSTYDLVIWNASSPHYNGRSELRKESAYGARQQDHIRRRLSRRMIRPLLRWLRWSRVGPGIVTIAIGVLVALWIAKFWR
jgi:hypothetical protein